MDINSIKTNAGLLDAGQWVSDIPGMGNLMLRVRGDGSRVVAAAHAAAARALGPDDRGSDGHVTETAIDRLRVTVLAGAVLLEWSNLTAGAVPVPYSEEQAKAYLADPDFGAFRAAVEWAHWKAGEIAKASSQAVLDKSEDAPGN